MPTITIPFNYTPRTYQLPLWEAMDGGIKRAVVVWHRRSGKDKTLINLMVSKAVERVGAYYYFFPTYKQGKKILWDGRDRDGFKFLDHIPVEIRKRSNDTELKVELVNGSIIQIIGTDNIDSIVGTNPVGCVFSEYALQDPQAWSFIRPILAENGGWAVFNYTPRGNNHGKRIYDLAVESESWFAQKLTVDDTGVIPVDVLENEKKEMFAQTGNDSLYEQEYMCSFDVPVQGAYYGQQLVEAEKDNRVTRVPYDPSLPVHTAWDLGIGDSNAIWFLQTVGQEIRVIDYYETNGESMAYYVKYLQEKKYVYGNHYAPHDIEVRELSTGKTRKETASSLGINFVVAPRIPVDDGIDAVRNLLNKCWFDKEACERGLDALKSYHKVFDEDNQMYKNRPEHDWSSHGADAFRTFAVSYVQEVAQSMPPPLKVSYDETIGI